MPQIPDTRSEITKAQYDYIVSLCCDLDISDHHQIIAHVNDLLELTGDRKHSRLGNLNKHEASLAITFFKDLRDSKKAKDKRQKEMFEDGE